MKNIMIIIGTIILGGIIVTTMILGDAGTLEAAAKTVVQEGIEAVGKIEWT